MFSETSPEDHRDTGSSHDDLTVRSANTPTSSSTENCNDGSGSDKDYSEQPSSDTDREETILSVYWRSGKLGAAVYSLQNPVVFVLNDVLDDFLLGFKILRKIIFQVQPTQIVTCKKMPRKFIVLLNHIIRGTTNEDFSNEHINQENIVENLHLLPDAEFRNQNSLRQVLNMRLPEEPQDWQEEEHNQFIRSIIDTRNDSMVNALARLLKYLNNNLAWLCLSHNQNPILAVRTLCIDEQMWVSSETYQALGVFSQTAHPSLFKWTPGAYKEGLSIFGLFNRCHSKLGSKFMRAALMQPVSDQQELNKRHQVISFCFEPSNEDVVRKMQSCIAKVQSISGMLPRLFAAQATVAQWKALKKTNHNVLLLREICSQFKSMVPFFDTASTVISDDLYKLDRLMERVIDFQTSEQLKKFVVMSGIDEQLDEMKHVHANLVNFMNEIAPLELPDMPAHIQECSVTYIPELGFLVNVPKWKDELTEEDIHIPGFTFKFTASNLIYYKSPRCRELDSSLGDISLRVRELELKIMLKLVQYIQRYINSLIDSLSFVGELDCLIAFAVVAKQFGYVKPIFSSKNEIIITEGRHPLQENFVNNFVPNHTYSSKEHGFVKILTGPNASGKSVYLKQVALIAFLAHTGSFVPAKKAVIGIVDQIHTIIQTGECTVSQLSAFMIDLRQMNTAMSMSTKSTLVVIDEFGKGTSEVDGLTLLAAYVSYLVKQGAEKCPHVFISTHFHELINIIDNSSLITTQILEHTVSDGELVYLYQLKNGQISSSLAFDVALASGISQASKNRANEILMALQGKSRIIPVQNHKKMHLMKEKEKCLEWFLSTSFIDKKDIIEFKNKLRPYHP